jgi:enoyl-CoA hydratase
VNKDNSLTETEVNTTQFTNILSEAANGILKITINRPEKLNALNYLTIQEIGKAVENGVSDAAIAGIIITGAGEKAFVAGADISEFAEYTAAAGRKISEDGQKVFRSIELSPKPVIAAINGFALGGGCELAMSCHMRIAAENAKFGQPEVNLGLIPGYGGTQRMVQHIGKGKAMELMMTGDMINAEEALRLGLVNHVTANDALLEKCEEIIRKIEKMSPVGVAAVVKCVDAYYTSGADGFKVEVGEFAKCFTSDDAKEGIAAFREKRKPGFKR